MQPNEFLIGSRYRNRIQGYEVLDIRNDQIRVRYDDLTEEWGDAAIFARIHTNIQREEAGAFPRQLPAGRNQDFAWTLGMIAVYGELHAEVPPQSWRGFEHDYRTLTGNHNIAAEPCVFQIAIGGENKWGSELRIYIPARFCANPRFVLPANLNLVAADVPENRRINNNEFWWHLVERLNFRAGRTQNLQEIEARLPDDVRASFRQGCQVV
jgi:hypothetical protein